MVIAKVWIEEGCISCSLCADLCPDVFLVQDGEECIVKPEAEAHYLRADEDIRLASEDCPVEVIRFDTSGVSTSVPSASS